MSDQPPALPLLLREVGSFAYMRLRASFAPRVKSAVSGDGRTIIVFPGFMASDRTTSRLRRTLKWAGFDVHGWGLGRNRGIRADTLEKVERQIKQRALKGPVTLVGWSLGGLVAREYAKRFPDQIARVITLGSPFSGSPGANNVWRVYELVARHKVDAPPIDTFVSEKPPVKTIAFWSAKDGVVAPHSARGLDGERDQAIELDCTHMAFVADPDAIHAITMAIIAD